MGSTSRRYDCPRCGRYALRVRTPLRELINKATGAKSFKCDYCEWKGWMYDGLSDHPTASSARISYSLAWLFGAGLLLLLLLWLLTFLKPLFG